MSDHDLLGRLLLLTIRERVLVPLTELEQIWDHCNLPASWLPRRRSPQDAFRVATSKEPWPANLVILPYRGPARPSPSDHLIRVLVYTSDSKRRVDIHTASRAAFYLRGDQIVVEPFTPLRDIEQRIIRRVIDDYDQARNFADGSMIRRAVGKIQHEAHVLTFKDGVYLVPRPHFHLADAIITLIRACDRYTSGSPSICFDVPYLTTATTRDDTYLVLSEHINKTVDLIYQEAQALSGKRLRRRGATLLRNLDHLEQMLRTYQEILTVNLAVLNETIQKHRQIVQALVA